MIKVLEIFLIFQFYIPLPSKLLPQTGPCAPFSNVAQWPIMMEQESTQKDLVVLYSYPIAHYCTKMQLFLFQS